jgi:hypothetical protein
MEYYQIFTYILIIELIVITIYVEGIVPLKSALGKRWREYKRKKYRNTVGR